MAEYPPFEYFGGWCGYISRTGFCETSLEVRALVHGGISQIGW